MPSNGNVTVLSAFAGLIKDICFCSVSSAEASALVALALVPVGMDLLKNEETYALKLNISKSPENHSDNKTKPNNLSGSSPPPNNIFGGVVERDGVITRSDLQICR